MCIFFLRKIKGLKKKKKQGEARGPSTGGQTLGLILFFSLVFFFVPLKKKIIRFTYSLVLTYFLNTIINSYLNFNNLFFNYYVSDMKIIILIINYS
jgi:hypothetical protein